MERIGLTSGSQIGGYTIVAPLGSGGMGTVYRAVDDGGEAVALKLLHPHVASDAAVRARLGREVAALQRLRHPAVAAVLDAEADSTEAFLVTELVAGDTLTDRVRKRGPLDADELLELAEGLRSALAAVHGAGVIHRDLKPSNVMLTGDGPVLIDFGLAQGLDDEANLTSAGFVLGTPGYLAPELLDGGEPGVATDMWGWAALLAYAATGRDPFGTRPVEAVLARARAGEVDLEGVGPLARAAIAGALQPAPGERSAPEDVVAALRTVATEGEPAPGAVPTVALGTGALVAAADAAAAGSGEDEDEDEDLDGDDLDDEALEDDDGLDDEALEDDDLDDEALGDDDLDDDAVELGDDDLDDDDDLAPDHLDDDGLDEEDDELETELVAQRPPSPQDAQPTIAVGTSPATAATVVAPLEPPVRDGSTVAVPVRGTAAPADAPTHGTPHLVPDDDTSGDDVHGDGGDWLEGDLEDPEGEGEPGDDEWSGYERPPARRRWGSLLALGLVVALAGALYPVVTLAVVLVLVVVVRTVGGTVEAMHTRRERRGVRGSDVVLAGLSTPWYLLRALLGVLPALLVGAAVVVIVGGFGWWLMSMGEWRIDGSPAGQPPQGTTATLLVGLLVVLGVVFLWWGPLSRMTRTGARRTLALVAPAPVGPLVVVVVAIVASFLLADRLLDVQPISWWPAPAPTLPDR